jgi:hypothetical protein
MDALSTFCLYSRSLIFKKSYLYKDFTTLASLNPLFLFVFGGTGNESLGLPHARQVLYHWSAYLASKPFILSN